MVGALLIFSIVVSSTVAKPMTITCRGWECVERVISEAHTSPNLTRLRVFRGAPPKTMLGEGTAFPPLLDLTFQ